MTLDHRRRITLSPEMSSLAPWVDAGVFGPAEIHGSEVVARSDASGGPLIRLAASFAIWAPLHGHACADLRHLSEAVTAELAVGSFAATEFTAASVGSSSTAAQPADVASTLPWPDVEAWIDELQRSPLVRVLADPDPVPVLDDRPLVLKGDLLYTQRQWADECSVAVAIADRLAFSDRQPSARVVTDPATVALIDRLFPADSTQDAAGDAQRSAAHAALSSRLTVIVGGPGTGKTYTVARALAAMLSNTSTHGQPVRIGLAAPTGKAAARMKEAVAAAAAGGSDSGALTDREAVHLASINTSTIHRLLGWRGSSTRFLHDATNPVPYDIVVIDEASMVALPLMARLLEAIHPETRLILVGDPDQLQSIEVGAVLADLVTSFEQESAVRSSSSPVIRLQRSRRQRVGSPIGPLAEAVRSGQAERVIELLHRGAVGPDDGRPILTFVDTDDPLSAAPQPRVRDAILVPIMAAASAARDGDAASALGLLSTIRVLCAHREGPFGANQWNRLLESWLSSDSVSSTRFYPGQALMATRNDVRQRVSNGDTGIVISHPDGIRAAFMTAAGMRLLAPAQLERVETAFATTIHKSQGSEFATVVVVLAPASSPLATRELLYTALTRSTERLVVVGTDDAIRACVNTPSHRVTGLAGSIRSRLALSGVPMTHP